MSDVHICWTRADREWRRILPCPTCRCRRRFYVWAQDWYDPVATCCACGDRWGGGERMPRPAVRGWRIKAATDAKARYAAVRAAPPVEGER